MPEVKRNGPDGGDRSSSLLNGVAAAVVLVLFLLLPLIYFLSLGPAIVMVDGGYLDLDTAQAIYKPLEWLADNSPLGPFIEWYADLWQ